MRQEKDYIGIMEIEENALYGIHSQRARMNFPDTTPFHPEWFQAVGTVKKACYQAARSFFEAARTTYPDHSFPFHVIDPLVLSAMTDAAGEVEEGLHIGSFIVPAVQGGRGNQHQYECQ